MAQVKKSLGESLVAEGIITSEQLKKAQEEEARSGQRLSKAIVKLSYVAEDDLMMFLSKKLGIPRLELSNYLIDPKIIELIPESLARKHELIPVLKIGNRVTCAMADPWNIFALDEIRAKTNLIIEPAIATENEIRKALDEYYGAKGSMEDLIKSIDNEKLGVSAWKEMDVKKLKDVVEEPVVIRLVNMIITKAIKERASDIHIEPEENELKTRFRVDGMLREVSSLPKHLQSAIISRIKIMSGLDIAERRIPQDGRFTIKMEGRHIDARVSCVPTIYGENTVLRLLDASSAVLGLEELGFSKEVLSKFDKLINRPHGIILVTGPTGSGKTTTLYASLNKINTIEKNIITVEDPVEYNLPGVRQIQINPKVELTFANGLRSILRQDPNVIMIGEMRDYETAEIAIQAALTGHLVFSTLHTNDAPGAVTRMIDMGVEPFLVSSSVIGILAQRLVRMVCSECKEKYEPTQEELKDMGLTGERRKILFYRGKGCPKCLNTGYKGRAGIYEFMIPDDKIRNAIIAKFSSGNIRKLALAGGMITLKDDGIQKIKQGVTTVEEVLRVTED
ncbi:MAG: type II secretion system protein GspE [Omnitrophica bacterium RIFCSPHIGHO2_02_FULL_46_20]|nr:MAG: type II secretion system protein GspE [Omnitrophica bacterium RIFCSPHIGHO2_02_FULL_46_20]